MQEGSTMVMPSPHVLSSAAACFGIASPAHALATPIPSSHLNQESSAFAAASSSSTATAALKTRPNRTNFHGTSAELNLLMEGIEKGQADQTAIFRQAIELTPRSLAQVSISVHF